MELGGGEFFKLIKWKEFNEISISVVFSNRYLLFFIYGSNLYCFWTVIEYRSYFYYVVFCFFYCIWFVLESLFG